MANDPKDLSPTHNFLFPSFCALADSLGGTLTSTLIPDYGKWISGIAIKVRGVDVAVCQLSDQRGGLNGARFDVAMRTSLAHARTEMSSAPFRPSPSFAPVALRPILLRRERALDRFGKALGINREFRCGDPSFDDAVYVEAANAALAPLLRDSAVRAPILDLVKGVARDIEILGDVERGAVQVSVRPQHFGDRAGLLACVDALVRLAAALDDAVERGITLSAEPPEPIRWARGIASGGFALSTWIVALDRSPPPTVGWHAFAVGLPFGFVAWIASAVVFGILFRGRPTSLRTVIIFATCALGLLPCGGRVAEILNATHDDGPRTTTRTTASTRHRAASVVQLSGSDVDVPDKMLTAAPLSHSPREVTVVLGYGALGSPWVVSVEP